MGKSKKELTTILTNAAITAKITAGGATTNEQIISGICGYLSSQNGKTPAENLQAAQKIAADTATYNAASVKNETNEKTIYTACLGLALPTIKNTVKTSIDTAVASLDSYNTFYQGVLAYTAGVSAAADGSAKVNAGAKQLKDGAAKLKAGASQLVPGVEKLSDGSKQLADGIKQLNDKGISKLTGLAGDDLQNLVDRVKATVDVSKNYKSFAGIADGTDGSVKFIYKTDEVKSK